METKLKPEVKEKVYKPVYLRFGRGNDTEALTLDPEIVRIISEALIKTTNEGDMYTTGPEPHRSPKGHAQAEKIWKIVSLLEEKAD